VPIALVALIGPMVITVPLAATTWRLSAAPSRPLDACTPSRTPGVPKALSVIMGHATITMTFYTYSHPMPGGLDEAAAQTNAYPGERPALAVVG
jgi:hypothetical protein